jgi:hypothetical protein
MEEDARSGDEVYPDVIGSGQESSSWQKQVENYCEGPMLPKSEED